MGFYLNLSHKSIKGMNFQKIFDTAVFAGKIFSDYSFLFCFKSSLSVLKTPYLLQEKSLLCR